MDSTYRRGAGASEQGKKESRALQQQEEMEPNSDPLACATWARKRELGTLIEDTLSLRKEGDRKEKQDAELLLRRIRGARAALLRDYEAAGGTSIAQNAETLDALRQNLPSSSGAGTSANDPADRHVESNEEDMEASDPVDREKSDEYYASMEAEVSQS